MLAQCRQQYEAKLQADPARAGWVPLLQYHHGVALREAGKRAEARAVFDQVVKQAPDRPEAADAALRFGQCLKDDGQQKIADAGQEAGDAEPQAGGDRGRPEHDERRREGPARRGAVPGRPGRPAEAEAAGSPRPAPACSTRRPGPAGLADLEVQAARDKIQQDLWQKRKDEIAKKTPPGQPPPAVPLPDVPLTAVPLQPSETQARAEYQALITAFPDLAINADARFELAELQSDRGEHDAAIKQLQEALDKEPSPELTDKIQVRLGAALLAKGDAKKALDQLTPIANNPKSAMVAQATYRAAECQLQLGKPDEAVKLLALFRDKGEFQNLPGLTDRALLRLGYALAQQKQWEPSRQAYEQVYNRFGNGPWATRPATGPAGRCRTRAATTTR